MAKKITLPDGPDVAYVPPENATLDELTELQADAYEQANQLLQDGATAEDVAQADRLISAAETIAGRVTELQTAAADHQRQIEEARARIPTQQADEDEGEGAGDEGAGGGDDQGGGNQPNGPAAGNPAEPAQQISEPVLVAAASQLLERIAVQSLDGRPNERGNAAASLISGGSRTPRLPTHLERQRADAAFMTAGAGIRGLTAGQEIDWGQMGQAAANRFAALPQMVEGRPAPRGTMQNHIGAVNIRTEDEALVAAAATGARDFANIDQAIEWAVSRHRLERLYGLDAGAEPEVLLAAGGWCSPSETLYDLLDVTTADGMLDLPGITVNRGGVRYSLGPDFSAVYTAGGMFTRTEAQAIAGTPPKPVVNIPCPQFADHRMLVDGIYLTADILTSRGFPEAYEDFMRKALKAFAHYVNAATVNDIKTAIGTMVDISAAVGTAPVTNRTGSAAVELLGALELQIMDMRYRNRLSMTQTVEVILPFWVKGNLRSDIAKRQGYENALKLPDSEITEWFTERGATIQFIYDWQDYFSGQTAGMGGPTAPTAWPKQCEMLIYPEGTFVRALDPVIELNAVYDSTLLANNQYVALFLEQARLVLQRQTDARWVKVDVTPLGGTSAGMPIGANGLSGNVL